MRRIACILSPDSSHSRAFCESCSATDHTHFELCWCIFLRRGRKPMEHQVRLSRPAITALIVVLLVFSACGAQQGLPTPRIAAAVIPLAKSIYVIGGSTSNSAVADVHECDPSTGSCREKAPLPTSTGGACGVELDGVVFVTGGRDNQEVFNRLITYTPSTNTWTTKKAMSTARWNHMCAAVAGKVYVFGGVAGTGNARRVLGDVLVYQPERDEWTEAGAMPQSVQAAATAVVNGKVLLIGGRTATQPTATGPSAAAGVYEFDPATGTWRTRQPMPTSRTGVAAAVLDGKVFVVGGGRGDQAVTAVEVYDPATDSWVAGKPLKTGRTGHGAVSIDNQIYVIGGASRSSPMTFVGEIERLTR